VSTREILLLMSSNFVIDDVNETLGQLRLNSDKTG